MTPAEVLAFNPGRCRHGHLLTPDNVRKEANATSKGGFRIRCKKCVAARKRVYERKTGATRRAYYHHYRNGHPEGLLWDEIKHQFQGSAS